MRPHQICKSMIIIICNPRRIMYLYMYVCVHKYICAYMHVYKHVYMYICMCVYIKNQMPNHQIISPGRICVWLMLCTTNNISYSASLVHMDYECLTYLDYFITVVITYAMHVLCTCVYVHIC